MELIGKSEIDLSLYKIIIHHLRLALCYVPDLTERRTAFLVPGWFIDQLARLYIPHFIGVIVRHALESLAIPFFF